MAALTAEQVFAGALELPKIDRARLLRAIADSFDAEEADPTAVEAAWVEELVRRSKAIEDGTAKLVDADGVHARMRAVLAAMRSSR